MNTIAENSQILNQKIIDSLYPYQVDSLCRKVREYITLNEEADKYYFDECPKCHDRNATFSHGGYTYKKDKTRYKPLLKCSSCHARFVSDRGQLSFYSHLDKGIWNKIMEDTLNGVSMLETAAEVNIHPVSVFRNRHKLLNFIEKQEKDNNASGVIELDEAYVSESHKGLVDACINENTVEITVHNEADKPGLSNDKVCIITAVSRESVSYVRSFNTGKPSHEDVKPLSEHILNSSYVLSDGITVYEKMLKDKGCRYKELIDIEEYDKLNHLNNVNSFHSRIKEDVRRYRGTNSIYANRYNALYSLKQKYLGYDTKEIQLKLLCSFHKSVHYFFQRQMREDIFDDPHVLEKRKNLIPAIQIGMLRKKGYIICYRKAVNNNNT